MSGITDLPGRVAVVTGGASGIGRGIAHRLIERGAHVVLADVERDRLAATATELGALAIPTDVTDPASVASLASSVIERFGRVDIVCNNAGVAAVGLFEDLTLEDLKWTISVNLWGVINGAKAFLPHLRANPAGGWIVNTASMAGLLTMPGAAAYAVSKFGVVAFTEVLAAELAGSNVGASVLVPALVRSDIGTSERNRPGIDPTKLDPHAHDAYLPEGRMLEPDDVGEQVIAALARGDLYIVTHPEMLPAVQQRAQLIEAAFLEAAQRESGS